MTRWKPSVSARWARAAVESARAAAVSDMMSSQRRFFCWIAYGIWHSSRSQLAAGCRYHYTVTIHNRWVQLGASLVAMIMIANLQYSWTLFVEPMRTATGWKLSDIQWAFTLFILFQTWVQPAQGFLIDRLGPRVFTTVAGVLCGIGWTGLGLVNSLPALYALYVLAGIGAALIYGGCMGSALKWFTTKRGLAAGLIAAGFGGGTALFIPFIASIIKTRGYQSAF